MYFLKSLAVLLCVFSLTGCNAMMHGMADELNDLKVGMTKSDVVDLLGEPATTAMDGDKNEEILVYRRMVHVIAWGPQSYEVLLRDGKVIKWGRYTGK